MVSDGRRREIMSNLKLSEILIIAVYLTVLLPVEYSLWYLIKIICLIGYILTLIYKYNFKKEGQQNKRFKK